MKYKELYLKTKNSNEKSVSTSMPVFTLIFRTLSFFVTPFFLQFNISANVTSYCILFIGLYAAIIISIGSSLSLKIGLIFFFIAEVFDRVDGNIARVQNTATFYGRFIDGYIDIIILCVIRLSFSYVLFIKYQYNLLMWIGIICTILTPLHHLTFDRYSAFARWIKEEKQINIKPYIVNKISLKFMNLMYDLQHIFLILTIFSFFIGLCLYFVTNIIIAIVHIFYHIKCAYTHMMISGGGKFSNT